MFLDPQMRLHDTPQPDFEWHEVLGEKEFNNKQKQQQLEEKAHESNIFHICSSSSSGFSVVQRACARV